MLEIHNFLSNYGVIVGLLILCSLILAASDKIFLFYGGCVLRLSYVHVDLIVEL